MEGRDHSDDAAEDVVESTLPCVSHEEGGIAYFLEEDGEMEVGISFSAPWVASREACLVVYHYLCNIYPQMLDQNDREEENEKNGNVLEEVQVNFLQDRGPYHMDLGH